MSTGKHRTGLRSLMICPKDWSTLEVINIRIIALEYSSEPHDIKTTLDVRHIRPMKVDEDPGFDIQLYPAYWEYSAKPNK